MPLAGELVWVLPGAGIVGTPVAGQPGKIRIDYEANRYGSHNLHTLTQRLHTAADRHTTRYPTSARAVVDAEHLLHVAAYDPATNTTTVANPAALLAWLQAADPTISASDLAAEL